MMLHKGDIVAISGCGLNNTCKSCLHGCHQYVEGEILLAKVIEIKVSSNAISSMDKILFKPLKADESWDCSVNFTRRKWCQPTKMTPDNIIEVLF
ncbi:hypothetical protein LDC_0870 [sediment metagenome]|uniref:Uncharacterized protein n=1 Tax=sediment metagenome TaxID=749907 RepID=D9PH70_9ZZZZ